MKSIMMLCCCLVLMVGTAGATTHVVAPGSSIQAAIDAAAPGDIVSVQAGTYQENLAAWKDMEITKSLSLVGAGMGQTIVELTEGKMNGVEIRGTGLDVLIQGITFTRADGATYGPQYGLRVAETASSFTSLRLVDVEVAYTEAPCVDLGAAGTFDAVSIEDCYFHHAGTWGYLQKGLVSQLDVVDSRFEENGVADAAHGIGFDLASTAGSANVTVTGGSFSNNTMKGINLSKVTDVAFDGITAAGNGQMGISMWEWNANSSGITVRNSNLGGNGLDGILLGTEGTYTIDGFAIENCSLTGNGRTGLLLYHDYGGAATNVSIHDSDLSGNPGLRISAGSTVVDASGNWWGSSDPAVVKAAANGGVLTDFTPWLASGANSHAGAGFQGDFAALWADDDGEQVGAAGRIGEAIGLLAGSTLNLAPGVYEEQVEITTDLTLTGAGVGATIIRSPVDMALGFSTGSTTKYAVVYVHDTAGPTIGGLTVDGAGRGNLNVQFVGVGFWNAGGTVTDVHVTGVRDTPFSGAQHGVSVYAFNNTGGPYTVALSDLLIDDIQKNAMALLGDGLTVDLDNVTAIGAGPTDVTAQNGIQISNGAGGTVDDCHVEGVHWLGETWTASGILLSDASPVTVTGTTVDGAQTSGYLFNGSAVFQGCDVVNPGGDGLIIYNTTTAKALPRRLPSPYDAGLTSKAAAPDKALMTAVVSGCTLTGAGVTDMGGIVVYCYPGDIDFDLGGSTVSGWDYGVFLYEGGGALTGEAHGNEIRDNVTYGAWSNTAVPYDATGNWWGDATGPHHATLNPLGLGNEVSDNILFEPYSGAGGLAVLPAGSGPLQCGDTATLAFHYTPDAYTPGLQGYEVTFQAGSAVTCGVGDIQDAGSLVGLGDSDFFYPTDNGDGTFTVTGAILGPTPGLQAEADLFTVDFHAVATGVADVEILSVRFRDPSNDPIGAALTGATIEVDCTPPDPVTDIQAEPGHEKVVVSWTDPADDVVTLEVWRGLWYDTTPGTSAYPEYDDLPGDVIPTRPASRAAADASAEWVLAGTVAAGAETYTDGIAPRGVYYYEVFPVDAAGNYGPPAAANDRATNYWLGDVYPAGTYDGVVDGGDITVLGACFATDDGEAGYDDECDVGPTDTNGPRGIPETDSTIDLEDLMMFALNYSVVGPAKALPPASGPLALGWVRLDDTRWALRLPADFPQLKGLRLTAPLPEGISARVTAGSLADEQSTPVFLYGSDRGGLEVDLAVLGAGVGFTGTGDLFVVDLSAPADLAQVDVEARDLGNESLRTELGLTAETPETKVFHLAQNSPNPFNPSTKIVFSLAEARNVRLTVYGVDGRLVRTLVAEPRAAGRHEVIWYGRDDSGRTVASGTYVYRIEAGDWVRTGKMVLAK